ncbi:Enamine/imine deaminase|nr:Enamine/imine deaminase [Candidatus Pantoea persica]
MSREISTEKAPAAIGPYVQGVDLGSMIITSGQIPVDPATGAVPDAIADQAHQSLENVKAIVEAAGLQVGDIVKTTVFVKDLNDFATVNATYEAFFTEHNASFPARSCVEVARLPKDVKIEIEAIALRRESIGRASRWRQRAPLSSALLFVRCRLRPRLRRFCPLPLLLLSAPRLRLAPPASRASLCQVNLAAITSRHITTSSS